MGEAEDGFTPLSQLNLSSDYRHRVRVRISRILKTRMLYKLNAVVEDDTGTMNLMIFAEHAQGLIGVTAELLKEIADDGRCTMPAAISDILGSTRTFQVAIDKWSSSFVVKWVLNDDELTLLQHSDSVQLTVGGDSPLPKEDGYSSVSSCSSQLMEEKMLIIKRGTELKAEDEADPQMQNDSFP